MGAAADVAVKWRARKVAARRERRRDAVGVVDPPSVVGRNGGGG